MMSPEHAAYLEAFREQVAAPATAAADNRAAIGARLAAGETVASDDATDDARRDQALPVVPRWSQRAAGFMFFVKPLALSVGLAAAGLGVVKGGSKTWRALRDTPSTSAPSSTDTPSAAATPGPRPAAVPPPPAAAPLPSAQIPEPAPQIAAPAVVAPQPAKLAPTASSTSHAITPTGAPEDRLRQETELMQEAKAHLDRQDWVRVLTTLAQHADRFADGVLVPERVAWRTIARCKLGRGDAGEQLRAFGQQFPGSALTPMVRRACGGGTP